MLKVYRGRDGLTACDGQDWYGARGCDFDALFSAPEPLAWLRSRITACERPEMPAALPPPLASQEVWAAGVTYRRSRDARMAESKREASVYDRVYEAERPELFFKATPHRVVGHGGAVRIRQDSGWDVPEAELALAINREGRIFGYSIGNDMSSRLIEASNPLYLPQAKIYDACCALGPCLLLTEEPPPPATAISLRVLRDGAEVFAGSSEISKMKRQPEELVGYLFRDNSFPHGCYLLTGTGIVPEQEFTLAAGDAITITIGPIGTLMNRVAVGAPDRARGPTC
jgi:2-dehydro-3-deoxy-D-arabinonate dehydratase